MKPPSSASGDEEKAWNEAYGPRNEAFGKAPPSGNALARWKYQRYIKDYLRCIASVDENIGRMLDYLDEAQLTNTTIVVCTSDQGFYLGEHGWFDKSFMYEESLRMPLIIRYPGEIRTGVLSEMVMNLDLAPTFLDFAGVRVPSDLQGRSLREVARGMARSDWRRSIYYHYYEYPGVHAVRRHYGVRTERYKLIHFYHDIDAWELYELQNDPLLEMLTSPRQEQFGSWKTELPEQCLHCAWLRVCRGGCTKDRIRGPRDGNLNHFCRSYIMFFDHADEPLRHLARAWMGQRNRSPEITSEHQ